LKLVHQLSGRLRLRLKAELKKYSESQIEVITRSIPGIYSANCNRNSGSLLLYYDPEHISVEQIKEELNWHFNQRRIFEQRGLAAVTALVGAVALEKSYQQLPQQWRQPLLGTSLLLGVSLDPKVFTSGLQHLLKFQPNADSLTMVSILAAYLIKQPVTATTVMIMSSISNIIEEITDRRSHSYLESSLKYHSQLVHCFKAGKWQDIPLKQVKQDDILACYTGEKILVDGQVVAGKANINEAGITGEFQPARKRSGDQVFAGTVVEQGQLEIKAAKLGSQTEEAAIYRLLKEAQSNKSELQKTADRLAQQMVRISFTAAGLTYLLRRSLLKAISVLVIDFVCGVKLSSEIAILAAMNRFTQQKVIVKGGRTIENAAMIKEVVFDKTGTLTTGQPTVQKIFLAADVTQSQLLEAVGYGEQHVNHPIGRAIMKLVKQHQVSLENLRLEDEEVLTGYGIIAHNFHGQDVYIGSEKLMKQHSISGFDQQVELQDPTARAIYVAVDQQPLGIIVLNDQIRTKMKQTITKLRQLGVKKITMLTGDKQAVAQQVGQQLNIDHVVSELLPRDKVNYVKRAQQQWAVMMVGDGLNDAAALKWSMVGVTLGKNASGAAKNACDVLIQEDRPEVISEIIETSQQTMQIIRQNYAAVFALNTAAIILSLSGNIKPILSAIIHNGTTIGVILHSLIKLR
jgi:cation-transporting P-type ATPase C